MVVNNKIMTKMQKNRFERKYREVRNNKFGDFGLITKNEGRLELIHITIMRKKIKSFIMKKKSESDIIREKVWYFGRPNFLIQKKSKNSRMGKGKGLIERKVIRVRRNFTLFEFKGISLKNLKNLYTYLNKILSVKFFLHKNYSKTYSLWSKKNKYILYHDKYLFQ